MALTHSDALVIFGVTGDLAHKMIFPALYAMVKKEALKVPVIGVAFPKWSMVRLHKRVTDSIERSGGIDNQRSRCGEPDPECARDCRKAFRARPGFRTRAQPGRSCSVP